MKMTLKEAVERHEKLVFIIRKDKAFPRKMRYAIIRNMEKLEEEAKRYNSERVKICEELAEKDDSGNPIIENERYKIPEENSEKVARELEDMLGAEIEIDICLIPENVMEQCEQDDRYGVLSIKEEMALEFMMEK